MGERPPLGGSATWHVNQEATGDAMDGFCPPGRKSSVATDRYTLIAPCTLQPTASGSKSSCTSNISPVKSVSRYPGKTVPAIDRHIGKIHHTQTIVATFGANSFLLRRTHLMEWTTDWLVLHIGCSISRRSIADSGFRQSAQRYLQGASLRCPILVLMTGDLHTRCREIDENDATRISNPQSEACAPPEWMGGTETNAWSPHSYFAISGKLSLSSTSHYVFFSANSIPFLCSRILTIYGLST